MSNVSFKLINDYLESLGNKHVEVKGIYRWNVNEVTGALRNGIELPVMLIDAVEVQSQGSNVTPLIHRNTTAFTIAGKPKTGTGNLSVYEAQDEVLEFCQEICFDIEKRILRDTSIVKHDDDTKNWMYGLVDKNSFHFFKVGPMFSDGLYGYRCELTIKNKINLQIDTNKWSDL